MKIIQIIGVTAAILFSTSTLAAPVLDAAFNGNGKRNIWFDLPTEKWDEATDAVLQPDGKIVIVGFARKANYINLGDVRDLTVARLNADGSLDTSFATNGKLSMNLSTSGRRRDEANAVALDSLGRIYVAGNSERATPNGVSFSAGFVLRLNANGTLDASYNKLQSWPYFEIAHQIRFEDIAIDLDGFAVMVGTIKKEIGEGNDGVVVRLRPDGVVDWFFDRGVVRLPGTSSLFFNDFHYQYSRSDDQEIKRVAIAADGSIYAAGTTQVGSNDFDFVVYKLAENGFLVRNFGNSGIRKVSSYYGATYDRLADIKLLPNGNLRLLGNCRISLPSGSVLRGCLVGLTAVGAVDSTFNSFNATEVRTFPLNSECNGIGGEARALVLQSVVNSSVIVVGEQKPNTCLSTSQIAISQHSNVAAQSFLNLPYSTNSSWANGAVMDAQGRLLVVGATILNAADTDQASARFTGF